MKLHVRLLEKLIELPESSVETASSCPLRHLLDDLGLEVKGVEASNENGIVYTLETLANRGDHLSHVGVAREISARTLAHVKMPTLANQLSDRKASVPVRRSTDKCLKYALMDMSIPTGMALRNDVACFVEDPEKLHPIVSILNYVQMEMGQPMHAFDADKIEGEIVVELSTKPDEIDALDGKRYTVPAGSILIKDRKKIVAVAGVIGCSNSMVTGETRKVLIEAAVFDPVSVRITARAMGVSTDSSYAFERGCDYEGITPALKRVAYLAGGSAGTAKDTESAHVIGVTNAESAPTEKRKVTVLLSSLKKQLNLPRLEEVEVATRFKNLGYGVDSAPASGKDRELSLTVPSWRLWDVRNADDIYEDIARSVSLNRIKVELPALDYDAAPLTAFERVARNVRPALLGSGFVEVISTGFCSAADVGVLEQLAPGIGAAHLTLKNSIEAKNSHMKATNVMHLTKLLAANLKRGVGAGKVYELCRIFSRPPELPSDEPREREELEYDYEHDTLTIASAGRWYEGEWRKPEPTAEHARLFKGAVGGLIKGLGCKFSVGKGDSPFLHPGIQGSVKCGRHVVGSMGMVHPVIREACGTKEDVFFCELDLRLLAKLMIGVPAPAVSDYPAVWRDMTLQIGPREQAGRVLRLIHEASLEALATATIVDDFRKPEEDYRRVTYRITFQRNDRTLKSEEVDSAMGGLLDTLRGKHGIEMAT